MTRFIYDISRLAEIEERMLLIMRGWIATGDIEYCWYGYDSLQELIWEKYEVWSKVKDLRESMKFLAKERLVIHAPAFDLDSLKFCGSGFFLTELGEFVVDEIREKAIEKLAIEQRNKIESIIKDKNGIKV